VQVFPVLFIVNFVLGCFWMYFQFAFWRALKNYDPEQYRNIGGPENLLLGVSVWNLGRTFLFLLRGQHRALPVKSLRIMGSILFWSLLGFFITFPALFLVPQNLWL